MNLDELVNPVTAELQPYPMEELKKIRKELEATGTPVYDFGTGDPTIPTWPAICKAIGDAIPSISQYPSVMGLDDLRKAQQAYLGRRHGIQPSSDLSILPSSGSKEAIFHIALSVIGRNRGKKKRLIYPDPGYPVYRASALFAGGIPWPVPLSEENGFLLEPWRLPKANIKEVAAIWVNYPHNPTGATAPKAYWEELVAWCQKNDVILLSDECYTDIYEPKLDKPTQAGQDQRPLSALSFGLDRVIAFLSLSKRSGMTGHRCGFMAGDARILQAHARARANFGVGQPDYVQRGAVVAWSDDRHVVERRRIFSERMQLAGKALCEQGLLKSVPDSTFYLWCQVPARFKGDDIKFCLELAKKGVVASPSSWLSEDCQGYFRLALVPDVEVIAKVLPLIGSLI